MAKFWVRTEIRGEAEYEVEAEDQTHAAWKMKQALARSLTHNLKTIKVLGDFYEETIAEVQPR